MKKIKKQALICFSASLLLNISALILLPSIILLLFSSPSINFYNEIKGDRIKTPETIKVYISSQGKTAEIPFEEYVAGVVSSEMPSSFEEEALKAQAVAARTYSLSKVIRSGDSGFPDAHLSAPLCDDVHCQVYRSAEQLSALKGDEWMKTGYKTIEKAVEDTEGQLMYYDGQLVTQALFHSSSGGRTENSEDVFANAVPYLRSVESPYEEEATHRNDRLSFSLIDLASRLNTAYPSRFTGNFTISDIKIKDRTDGGRVETMQVGGAVYTGREIREALGLYSANFTISKEENPETITFLSSGYGHGVGMSQYGANGMAKSGYDYKEILTHYYTGVEIY